MAPKKNATATAPARVTSSPSSTTKAADIERMYIEQIAEMQRRLAALEAASRKTAALAEDEIRVGMRVAALIGPKKYAPAEVTDIFTSASGRHVYELRRLDGARKGIGLKEASELFPASFAGG